MSRIFFWSAGQGACEYYRCTLPARALAARGHDVLVSELMPDEWRDTADVIVGQRVCQPGASTTWQALAKQGRAKLVFEVDDDLLEVEQANGPAWPFFSRPEIRANLIHNIQVADLVTVSTEPLADAMRYYNPNVVVLPNCVPSWLLEWPPDLPHTPLLIGWSGGASHRLDLAELGGELTRFVRRHPEVSVHAMGDAQASAQLSTGIEDRTRFTPWVPDVEAFYRAVDFDIALAPLRPSVFNRSKSAIRCLEAAVLGIPVVASDFGPYSGFVRHGETGFLVSRSHEWSRYLRELLDPVVRQEMGAKARALAAQHTIEGNADLWEAALCE